MSVEIKIPEIGESITEATIAKWLVGPGDRVERDQSVAEIETDKVTMEIPSPGSGVVDEIVIEQGQTAHVGDVIARLGAGKAGGAAAKPRRNGRDSGQQKKAAASRDGEQAAAGSDAAPPPRDETKGDKANGDRAKRDNADKAHEAQEAPAPKADAERADSATSDTDETDTGAEAQATPAETKPPTETKDESQGAAPPAPAASATTRTERRERLSPMRRRIAQRLVEATQTTAMLTTFNEIDMSAVLDLRRQWGEAFEKRHDVRLGFMSFFVKAATEALRDFPRVNAMIDGDEVVYRDYADVAIAVSTDAGLVTPVLRNAHLLSLADIERHVGDFAARARSRELTLDELTGGTFTITNGGVFGSLLSTPILNPPQTAILGMHAVQERPVARDGAVLVRPMMYVALTYDHRLVDGREAVLFLGRIRDVVADPGRALLQV